jgi:YD repeat-containing protein
VPPAITYLYDALNRLTSKTYPDTTAVDYVYDLVGKIQQVNDPTGTYAFAYDNMGRLIGTTTIPRAEGIQAGFGVAFFAGEFVGLTWQANYVRKDMWVGSVVLVGARHLARRKYSHCVHRNRASWCDGKISVRSSLFLGGLNYDIESRITICAYRKPARLRLVAYQFLAVSIKNANQ